MAIALIGGSLTMDLSGMSSADPVCGGELGVSGLRIYLWLEGIALAALVTLTTLVLLNSCRYMRLI